MSILLYPYDIDTAERATSPVYTCGYAVPVIVTKVFFWGKDDMFSQENERRLLHWSRRGRWGPTEQHSFAGEGEKCEILVCSSFFIGFHSFSSSVVWSIGGGEPTILQKFKGERQDRNTLGQSNINYGELICIEDPCLIFFQNMCISPTSSPIQMEVGCMCQQDKNKYAQYCSFTLVQTGIVEQGFQSPHWVAMKFARLTIYLKKDPKPGMQLPSQLNSAEVISKSTLNEVIKAFGEWLPPCTLWPSPLFPPPLCQIKNEILTMKCFPFHSILLAVGNPTVDFFSLDVEGAELPILRTIPFDKVL